MSSLIPFRFESKPIRVLNVAGVPWFVAKDAADALDYAAATIANTDKMLAHVPEEWKGRFPIPTPGGKQEVWCLSEPGLYFFVNRSDKPKALPFQKWVAGEVLPAIRETGGYGAQSNPAPAPAPETVTLTKDEYIGLLKSQIDYLQATRPPKRTRRDLSAADKARIEQLRAQGLGPTAIGRAIGRSDSTVRNHLRQTPFALEG